MKKILLLIIVFINLGCKPELLHDDTLVVEDGEHWWAGVISDAHLFPLSKDSAYRFAFYVEGL